LQHEAILWPANAHVDRIKPKRGWHGIDCLVSAGAARALLADGCRPHLPAIRRAAKFIW
jgi:hypothetical protein